jgi:uncharacterized protein YegL
MTFSQWNSQDQAPFELGIARGSGRPVPILLLLDTSSSMEGAPIEDLNRALVSWSDELKRDEFLRQNGEIALISFGKGGVRIVSGRTPDAHGAFVRVAEFQPPTMTAGGVTPMYEAIRQGVRLVNDHRKVFRGQGIITYRPNVYLVSDGAPTDQDGKRTADWREAIPLLRKNERENRLLFFAIGVANADEDVLQALAPDAFYKMEGLPFQKLLALVSASSGSVATGEDPRATFQRFRRLLEESS